MTNKLKFDAERYCRHNAGRMSKWSVTGEDIATLIADEIKTLRAVVDLHEQGAELMRDEVARLKGELAALKGAVGNVVEMHRKGEGHVCTHYPSGRRALDALAALAGEEGK